MITRTNAMTGNQAQNYSIESNDTFRYSINALRQKKLSI